VRFFVGPVIRVVFTTECVGRLKWIVALRKAGSGNQQQKQ